MTRGMWVGMILTGAVAVTATAAPAAGQTAADAKTYEWVAALISTDGETATFAATARPEALRAAEPLTEGQAVILRWDGPRGQANQISGLRVVESAGVNTKRPSGPGQFAMRATFVSANPTARSLRFTVPLASSAMDGLTGVKGGDWLQLTSTVSDRNDAIEVASVAPLTRPRAD